jgi:hypothetical protein
MVKLVRRRTDNEAKIAGYFFMAAASTMFLVLNAHVVDQLKGGYSAL